MARQTKGFANQENITHGEVWSSGRPTMAYKNLVCQTHGGSNSKKESGPQRNTSSRSDFRTRSESTTVEAART